MIRKKTHTDRNVYIHIDIVVKWWKWSVSAEESEEKQVEEKFFDCSTDDLCTRQKSVR